MGLDERNLDESHVDHEAAEAEIRNSTMKSDSEVPPLNINMSKVDDFENVPVTEEEYERTMSRLFPDGGWEHDEEDELEDEDVEVGEGQDDDDDDDDEPLALSLTMQDLQDFIAYKRQEEEERKKRRNSRRVSESSTSSSQTSSTSSTSSQASSASQNARVISDLLHPCSICQKSFKTRGARTNHMKKCQKVQETGSSFQCAECGTFFEKAADYNGHQCTNTESNSGSFIYQCDQCNFCSDSTQTLNLHIGQKHHDGSANVCELILMEGGAGEEDKTYYRCTECKKIFTDEASLKKHNSTKHGRLKHRRDNSQNLYNKFVSIFNQSYEWPKGMSASHRAKYMSTVWKSLDENQRLEYINRGPLLRDSFQKLLEVTSANTERSLDTIFEENTDVEKLSDPGLKEISDAISVSLNLGVPALEDREGHYEEDAVEEEDLLDDYGLQGLTQDHRKDPHQHNDRWEEEDMFDDQGQEQEGAVLQEPFQDGFEGNLQQEDPDVHTGDQDGHEPGQAGHEDDNLQQEDPGHDLHTGHQDGHEPGQAGHQDGHEPGQAGHQDDNLQLDDPGLDLHTSHQDGNMQQEDPDVHTGHQDGHEPGQAGHEDNNLQQEDPGHDVHQDGHEPGPAGHLYDNLQLEDPGHDMPKGDQDGDLHHEGGHEGEGKVGQLEEYRCTLCDRKLKSKAGLSLHLRVHGKVERDTGSYFTQPAIIEKSVEQDGDKDLFLSQPTSSDIKFLYCKCGKKYKDVRANHAKFAQHKKICTVTAKFPCDRCPERFKSKKGLQNHLSQHAIFDK